MFTTMPQVFAGMPGETGRHYLLFFVFLAAITSSIWVLWRQLLLLYQDKFGWKRIPVCIGILLFSIALGVCSSLRFRCTSDGVQIFGKSILDSFDFLTNNILMPVVALCTCIFRFKIPKYYRRSTNNLTVSFEGIVCVFTQMDCSCLHRYYFSNCILTAAGIVVI